MSIVGPKLPPHLLEKRKRQRGEAQDENNGNSPQNNTPESVSPGSETKRRRIVGPAPPPAALEERPSHGPLTDDESSSDEDDYGPTLPSDRNQGDNYGFQYASKPTFDVVPPEDEQKEKKTQRDEWMMMPPKQDDLSARMDPTKIRARKFNTGKGAKGPNEAVGGDGSVWTETPDEKRKRLQDQVLGVSKPAATNGGNKVAKASSKSKAQDEEKQRRIREHNGKNRAKSLYDQYQETSGRKREEDDPGQRAFDYEKDMAGGRGIGHAQKREMLKRAADVGSRFSGGSYL